MIFFNAKASWQRAKHSTPLIFSRPQKTANLLKFVSILLILVFNATFLLAQSVKKLEKIVFTNPKSDGSRASVFLTVTITSADDIKLKMVQGTDSAIFPIHADLTHQVVKRLMEEKIGAWIAEFKNKTIEAIFPSTDIEKIDWLIVETIITKTALNNPEKNDLKAIFRFNKAIPYYREVGVGKDKDCNDFRQQQQQLTLINLNAVKVESYNAEQQGFIKSAKELSKKNDELNKSTNALLEKQAALKYSLDSLTLINEKDTEGINKLKTDTQANNNLISKQQQLIKLNDGRIKALLDGANKLIPSVQQTLYRDTICNGRHVNIQEGRLFIDSLEITIKGGYLRVLKFTFSDTLEVFSLTAPTLQPRNKLGFPKRQVNTVYIDLRSVSFSEFLVEGFLYLDNDKPGAGKYVFNLRDVLKYTPPQHGDLVETFVPLRSRLFFSDRNIRVEHGETDINKILTLNIFSDVVGIQEDRPNGLLQAEAKFTGSFQRDRAPRKLKYGNGFFFNYFEVNFTLSKIENKLKYLELLPADSFNYVHSFNLLQYQNLEFGASLNLFKYADDIHEAHLLAGAAAIRTGVRDSLLQMRDNQEVIVPRNINLWSAKYSLKAMYRLKAISRVGIDLSASLSTVDLLSNSVRQSAGAYDDQNAFKNTFQEYKMFKNLIGTYQAQVYYYANRDESQRLYARLALNIDHNANGNRFPSIQLGYSSDINKFLQFK